MDTHHKLCCLLLAMATATAVVGWQPAASAELPQPARNGSQLFQYLYGGRAPADPDADLDDLWTLVGHLMNAGRADSPADGADFPSPARRRHSRDSGDIDGVTSYQATARSYAERQSLVFMGNVAFAFPLIKFDIPLSGVQIPIFDYDSRDYFDF